MRDARAEALQFEDGKTRDDLDHDRMLIPGILKDLEIIGEAAAGLAERPKNSIH
jgi:uncharacterized protein with HEPN domain